MIGGPYLNKGMDTRKEDKQTDIVEPITTDDMIKERLDKMASTILRQQDEIRNTFTHVDDVKRMVATVKGSKAGPLLNLIDDKSLVIVGVVVIALVGMWKLTDPTILLTSVVSGLFGVATGRATISNKERDEQE